MSTPIDMAVEHGANRKKIESIESRLKRLLADMRRQGVSMSCDGTSASLTHRSAVAGRPHIILLGTYGD